jgi:hypothetical protein
MTDSQKKNTTNNHKEQYLKDMKSNTELFEQKLQKLKKKAKELQQKEKDKKTIIYKTKPLNRNIDKKYGINDKSNTAELNEQFPRSNTITFYNNNNDNIILSRVESKGIINASMTQDYAMNDDNDTNTSINKYYTLDDDFFNDTSIRKDYKIKELIKKNKQLKSELEYKNNYIESLEKEIQTLKGNDQSPGENNNINFNNFVSQSKLDEVNFELGRLTRELEEKNQKIENFDINNKNLTIKIENLVMQNKNLSNREKKLTDKNEYLSTSLEKLKDDNENYKKKIMKLEKLNQNILKDYEELNSDFTQTKKQKEKIESLSEEQKTKIMELNKQIKTLHNLLEETIKQHKRKKYYKDNNDYDSDDDNENINMKAYKKKKVRLNMYQNNNDNYNYNNDSDEYDNDNNNYNHIYKKKKYQLIPNKTMQNFYHKSKNKKKLEYEDDYDNDNIIFDNDHNNYPYFKRINNNKNYNTINDLDPDEDRRYSQFMDGRPSQHKKRKKNNYFNMDDQDQDDEYHNIDMDEILNHHYSQRNIFSGNKCTKKKLNGKQRNNEYLDYEYEGFNCFPSERQKRNNNKREIEELNQDLNMLLKNKNIMENNLIKLPGQSKTLNNIRQKKELNKKIIQTENKINEIRIRLKQLKGL